MYLDPPTERFPRVVPAAAPVPAPAAAPSVGRNLVRVAGRIAVGVAVLVVGVTLFGSSGDDELGASRAVSPAPPAALSLDDQFIAVVESSGQVVTDEAAIIAAGRGVCAAVDAGLSPMAVAVRITTDTDLEPRTAGYVVGAAVAAYCPQHRDQLPS